MSGLEIEVDGSLDLSRTAEWLETNGLGGYAASTLCGMNTRRYHGLLVAATTPPTGRVVLLSKLEEALVIEGRRHELSANQYAGVMHPAGYRYLTKVRLDPYPVFTYQVEGLELRKSVCMLQGRNATVIRYELVRPAGTVVSDVQLELRPLIAARDYHQLTHENGVLDARIRFEDGWLSLVPYPGLPELFLTHDAEGTEPTGYWYRGFEYAVERERGMEYQEDLFQPLLLRFDLGRRGLATLIASTERCALGDAEECVAREAVRRREISRIGRGEPVVTALAAAADQFLVSRGSGKSVIAGYPWFTDWGRDTMIALPGLTLVTGRAEIARGILLEFSRYVDQGMLPNRFPDAGETPEYNTIDATLWYFQAVNAFLRYSGDYEFVRLQLYPVLMEILEWHVGGTRYGIGVREDGLLASGPEGAQLTWMDARVGAQVMTPRAGCPVEIQALWYNALRMMEELSVRFSDPERARRYGRLARRARDAFRQLFWNPEVGCLYDVVEGERRDASVRPNQILALSLPHRMVTRPQALAVLQVVERELLTPCGLRSLAPSDPRYAGHYTGGPAERDAVYHQGTVWPWLMGPFLTAYLRAHRHSRAARAQAEQWVRAFEPRLRELCLGQLPEVTDGDAPYHPGGCPAQAWSVAELLRAALEDVWPALLPEQGERSR